MSNSLEALTRPLETSEIDFRVQSINRGGYVTLLAYKDARCDMKRLDEAFGPLGWKREHYGVNNNLYCRVSVWNPDIDQWICKSDVGTESFSDAVKGEASDAFKRACFNLGIGRELYDYPVIKFRLFENEWKMIGDKPKVTYDFKLRSWHWQSSFKDGVLQTLEAYDENGLLRYEYK